MLSFLNQGTIATIKNIKEKLDKFYTIIIGCLWTLSTLWDIITFHCYWSDYMLELYSCFFIVFMVLYLLFPAKVPKIITDQFGIITITLGRGIIMLVFSILFLGDKHLFHKLCAIFLFIGGFLITVLELIAPSDSNERKFYPSIGSSKQDGEINSHNVSIPSTKIDDSQHEPEVLDDNPNKDKLPSVEDKQKETDPNDFQFN
jgi:hypothetical protein